MSKKDTSYADAMNEWAAKQSFLRNRRNRFLHPNPELPVFAQAIGYFLRLLIVFFVLWLVGGKVANKFYNSVAFNEKLKPELASLLDAREIDTPGLSWLRQAAICKSISAKGNESAFYREFTAETISFKLPLLKRLKAAWEIGELRVESLTMELKSGGKSGSKVGLADDGLPRLIAAGLLPTPDLSKLKIEQLICAQSAFNWGLRRSTLGALDGARFKLSNPAGNWKLDLHGGVLRQNWLRDLQVDALTIRKQGSQLEFSDSRVWLGNPDSPGTLDGQITLGALPEMALELRLPKVATRALLPQSPRFPEYFAGDVELALDIFGSINTMAGIEMAGTAKLLSGTFSKVPAFDAIDQLLKAGIFRVFSPTEGGVEFTTGGGKLDVTRLDFSSAESGAVVRGNFTYTSGDADAFNIQNGGGILLEPKIDQLSGNLRVGVRPERLEGNELAQRWFKESAEGYVWIDIPLDGPLDKVTKGLHTEILSAILEAEQ